ncbi:MAG: hypothetical protein ACK56I_16995 [bacterium]
MCETYGTPGHVTAGRNSRHATAGPKLCGGRLTGCGRLAQVGRLDAGCSWKVTFP